MMPIAMEILSMFELGRKGVYPQSDDGFRWVDIDAFKVFVDLWVH